MDAAELSRTAAGMPGGLGIVLAVVCTLGFIGMTAWLCRTFDCSLSRLELSVAALAGLVPLIETLSGTVERLSLRLDELSRVVDRYVKRGD